MTLDNPIPRPASPDEIEELKRKYNIDRLLLARALELGRTDISLDDIVRRWDLRFIQILGGI